jgi:hypothetical protein
MTPSDGVRCRQARKLHRESHPCPSTYDEISIPSDIKDYYEQSSPY